jgi:YidC/Oxa1 family membrane protein insertase
MTDIRRTLLWGVFLMSLFLLWDAWNKHTGQPSFFSPVAVRPSATASAPSAPAATAAPADVPAAPTVGAAQAAQVAAAAAQPPASEQVALRTDVVKATFDSKGGDLVRLELLKYADQHSDKDNVVLFDRSAARVYLAQTGLA